MGQYCWAYHSWEYRQMITPLPKKRDVHMIMFQMGPFLWSCKMKLNITAGRMKVLQTKTAIIDCGFICIFIQTLLVWFLTSKAHEKAEEDRVEETKADCQNVLMDHSWYCKHKQHGRWFETLLRHLEETQQIEEAGSELSKNTTVHLIVFYPLQITTYPEKVPIHVVVQPVVNHHIPCAVVVGKRCWIPPIL